MRLIHDLHRLMGCRRRSGDATVALLVAACVAMVAMAPAHGAQMDGGTEAADPLGHPPVVESRRQSRFHEVLGQVEVSLIDAVKLVIDQFDAYAVGAEIETEDGMYYYEVELVSDDGTMEVYVNPANGIIIGMNREEGIGIRLQNRWQAKLDAAKKAKLTLYEAMDKARWVTGGHVIEADLRARNEPYFDIEFVRDDAHEEIELDLDGAILEYDVSAN